jgi:hypothetical protein
MTSFHVHIHDLTDGRLLQGRIATARFTLLQEIIVTTQFRLRVLQEMIATTQFRLLQEIIATTLRLLQEITATAQFG